MADDGGLVHLDDGSAGGGQCLRLLPQCRRHVQHQATLIAVVGVGGEGSQGIGAGEEGPDRSLAVGRRELVVTNEDGTPPAHGADDVGLAVVGVGIEVADEAADLEPLQRARDVGLVVVPADLAVGDDVEAGLDLLADGLDGDFVLHLGELLGRDVASVQLAERGAQAGGSRPVGNLRVVTYGDRLHAGPL